MPGINLTLPEVQIRKFGLIQSRDIRGMQRNLSKQERKD